MSPDGAARKGREDEEEAQGQGASLAAVASFAGLTSLRQLDEISSIAATDDYTHPLYDTQSTDPFLKSCDSAEHSHLDLDTVFSDECRRCWGVRRSLQGQTLHCKSVDTVNIAVERDAEG